MSEQANLRHLNLHALAVVGSRSDGCVERVLAGAQLDEWFPRLAAEACEPQGLTEVRWDARPELRRVAGAEPQVWMKLDVSARLMLVCQRCMTIAPIGIASQRWFRFVADEAVAAAEDDESDEDVLVLEPRFDLLALIEDELLMSLPLVPMHDTCPVPVVTQVSDPLFSGSATERINPFAELKEKLKLTGG